MNKKTIIVLIIAIAAALCICATSCSTSGDTTDPYEQQIQLGYKYLSEMDYEQAIIAFDKAISIDAKRDTAYIGKADTYLAKGGDDMIANIDESLKVGYEVTQSEGIVDAYIRIADELIANEKHNLALELLRKGYDATGSELLKEKLEELTHEVKANTNVVISASHTPEVENPPENTRDGDLATRWAADGACWIMYEFSNPIDISAVYIALWTKKPTEDTRMLDIAVEVSEDGENFYTIHDGLAGGTTFGEENAMQEFKLPKSAAVSAIRINGRGNTSESEATAVWTSILEVDWE